MDDTRNRKDELLRELAALRQEVAGLEATLAEHERSGEAVRASERLYRMLAESSDDFIFMVDREGRVRYVNAAAAEAFGKRPDEIIGRRQAELFPPPLAERHERNFRLVFETGEPVSHDDWNTFPTRELWLNTRLIPVRDEAGVVQMVVGVARDITARKRVEEALRESEEKWRSVVENAPDLIATIDRRGTILSLNRTMSGRPTAEVVGTRVYDYILPEFRVELGRTLARVFETGTAAWHEVAAPGPQDSVRWYSTRVGPIQREGRVAAAILISTDITGRRRAEAALRASEANYRAIFDAANDAIFVHDPQTGEILDVNQRVCGMFGYAAEEVRGKPAGALSAGEPPHTPEEALRWVRKAAAEGPQLFEWKSRDKAGRSFWVEVNLKKATISGQDRVLAVIRDITRRKEAQEALRRSEARYRAILEQQTELICRNDADGTISFVNDAYCRTFGKRPEELIGHSFLPLIPEEDRERVRAHFASLSAANPIATHEHRVILPNGEIRWMHWTNRAICDAQGRITEFQGVGHDITDRKQAERALRDSEERFRAIFEQAADSVVLSSTEAGAFVEFNDRAHQSLGYTREEFARLTLRDIEAVESPERVASHIAKVVRDGADSFETMQRTKSGELRDIHVNVRRISIRGRDFLLGVWRDITDLKRAEEAVRESEERYRSFVQNFHGIAYRGRMDFTPLFFHGAVEAITGYAEGEFLAGQPRWDQIIHPGDLGRMRESVEALRSTPNYAAEREYRILRKDGEVRWVQEFIQNLCDAQGRPAFVQGAIHDITERKRAEEALRLSEFQYRTTVDSLSDPMHVLDSGLRFVLMNHAFRQWCRELGLSTDVEGRHLFEVFPFLSERVRDECRQVFETGESLVTEETTRVGDREYITETRKIPVFEGGRVVRLITIVRDITDKRKVEQELLKAQKLESISLLAGGIAHDFNNLLTGIVSSIDFARHELGPEARLSSILGDAQRAAGRARSLVQRLLTFSGGGAPVKQPVHLAPVLRETAELAFAGSSVRCQCHMPEDLWAVDADPDQISQVVQNLLVNARQAMPGGGAVEVSAENVEIPPDTPLPLDEGRYVKLAVRDHGVGIPREHLPRIFDPFFTTKEGGSGLGLAVSYSIVKKHGGCIDVQSEVNVGTTFRIYLPAAPEDAGLERPRAAPPAGQGKVLLMDDDDIVRKGARRVLAECGYDVECARDGTVALELYRKARDGGQPFDAVILDLTVPDGMGGEECLARLRELDPQVRAIACSGYSEDSVLAQFREHGFQGVVRKPFTIEDLHGELHRLITEHPISTNFTTLSPPGSGRDGSGGAM